MRARTATTLPTPSRELADQLDANSNRLAIAVAANTLAEDDSDVVDSNGNDTTEGDAEIAQDFDSLTEAPQPAPIEPPAGVEAAPRGRRVALRLMNPPTGPPPPARITRRAARSRETLTPTTATKRKTPRVNGEGVGLLGCFPYPRLFHWLLFVRDAMVREQQPIKESSYCSMTRGRILYMTDKFGVSAGYMPAFTKMVHASGIPRESIVMTHIYNLVDKPLKKKANERLWRFDPDKLEAISAAFRQRVLAIRPTLIVVSCPAILGVLTGGDVRAATLDKMRGSLNYFEGIPTIVVLPITAINQRIDSRIISNDDGEEDKQTPYQIPDGKQILLWDWQKVGRFYQGKQRKLPPFRYSVCRTLEDCYAARKYLADCVLIATDIETGNYPPGITCVGYTGLLPNGAVHSFVIPFHDPSKDDGCFWPDVDSHAYAQSVVADINNNPVPKTMHNGSYDCSYFIQDRTGTKNWLFDSMVMWWSLYMELPKKLGFVTSVLCDNYQFWKDDIKGDEEESVTQNVEGYWRYNALDTYYTLFNTCYLVSLMSRNKAMATNYNDAFMRTLSRTRHVCSGYGNRPVTMAEHRGQLISDMEQKTQEFRYLIDEPDFNINSAPQKCSLLYDLFGLRERTARGRYVDRSKPLTGGNSPSAGAIPVKMAKTEHPLFKYILDRLDAAIAPRVQLSNVFGYPQEDGKIKGGLFMPKGRLRTSFCRGRNRDHSIQFEEICLLGRRESSKYPKGLPRLRCG